MDTDKLKQFCEVVRQGSVSQAARNLSLTQPALSRSIKRLEAELDCELLDRTANAACVNDAGRLIAERAEDVLAAEQRLRDALDEHLRRTKTIRIATCAPAPLWTLAALVTEVAPGVLISSGTLDETEIRSRLLAGTIDFGVLRAPLALPGYRSTRLFTENLFVCVPAGHPLEKLDAAFLSEFDGETFITGSGLGFWLDICRAAMPNATFMEQPDPEVYRRVLRPSQALSFITDVSAAVFRHAERDQRKRITLKDPAAHVSFFLVTKDGAKGETSELAQKVHALLAQ